MRDGGCGGQMAHQVPPRAEAHTPAPQTLQQKSEEAQLALQQFIIPPEEYGSMIDNAEYRNEYRSRLW
jgi:hypothetical protein